MIRRNSGFCGYRLDKKVYVLLNIDLFVTTMIPLYYTWMTLMDPKNYYELGKLIVLFIFSYNKVFILVTALTGTIKRKPQLLLPYLICNVFTLLLIHTKIILDIFKLDLFVSIFMGYIVDALSFRLIITEFVMKISLVFSSHTGVENAKPMFTYKIMVAFLNLLVNIYYFSNVHGYYKSMHEELGDDNCDSLLLTTLEPLETVSMNVPHYYLTILSENGQQFTRESRQTTAYRLQNIADDQPPPYYDNFGPPPYEDKHPPTYEDAVACSQETPSNILHLFQPRVN